jgi:hypothetical protein
MFNFLASKHYMWVQWTSIGTNMLKKHFFEFLEIYYLTKSFKAHYKIKEKLKKEKPFLILFPFWKSIT